MFSVLTFEKRPPPTGTIRKLLGSRCSSCSARAPRTPQSRPVTLATCIRISALPPSFLFCPLMGIDARLLSVLYMLAGCSGFVVSPFALDVQTTALSQRRRFICPDHISSISSVGTLCCPASVAVRRAAASRGHFLRQRCAQLSGRSRSKQGCHGHGRPARSERGGCAGKRCAHAPVADAAEQAAQETSYRCISHTPLRAGSVFVFLYTFCIVMKDGGIGVDDIMQNRTL